MANNKNYMMIFTLRRRAAAGLRLFSTSSGKTGKPIGFDLTPAQLEIQETARKFTTEHIIPKVRMIIMIMIIILIIATLDCRLAIMM